MASLNLSKSIHAQRQWQFPPCRGNLVKFQVFIVALAHMGSLLSVWPEPCVYGEYQVQGERVQALIQGKMEPNSSWNRHTLSESSVAHPVFSWDYCNSFSLTKYLLLEFFSVLCTVCDNHSKRTHEQKILPASFQRTCAPTSELVHSFLHLFGHWHCLREAAGQTVASS